VCGHPVITPGALPLGNFGSEVMGAAALLELRLAALLDELTGAPIT